VIIFFNDNIRSTERNIEACRMPFSIPFIVYIIFALVDQTPYQYVLYNLYNYLLYLLSKP
jgi:hypothetical protein